MVKASLGLKVGRRIVDIDWKIEMIDIVVGNEAESAVEIDAPVVTVGDSRDCCHRGSRRARNSVPT